MATYSLYDHGTPVGTASGSDGVDFIVAVGIEVETAGNFLEGYWWYCGGQTAAQTFCLWGVTGGTSGGTGSKTAVLIPDSTVTTAASGSGKLVANSWNFIPLAAPVPLGIATSYLLCTGFTISGAFANMANQFNSGGAHPGGIVNGPLVAYSDATAGGTAGTTMPWGGWAQCQFVVGAGTDPTVAPPTGGSNSSNFGMDGQVTDVTPSGYAGPLDPFINNPAADVAFQVDLDSEYVVATEFWLSQPCYVNYIRHVSPSGAGQVATAADIWRISDQSQQFHVSAPSWTGTLGAGWMQYDLPPGTWLPAGQFKVSAYNGNGTGLPTNNGATGKSVGYYAPGGRGASNITWGALTIPCVASASTAMDSGGGGPMPGQGTYANPTTGPDQYPGLYAAAAPGQFYWVIAGVTPIQSTAHTAGATVTLSPSASAGRTRGRLRHALASILPAFIAGRSHGQSRHAALQVSPVVHVTGVRGRTRAASVTVAPSRAAGGVRGRVRAAALSVTAGIRAGAVKTTPAPPMTLAVTCECDVYAGLALEATIEINVGAPYQGDIRSLAADRWYSTYPS